MMHKSKLQDDGVEIRNLAVIFEGAHWYDTIQWLNSGVRHSPRSATNVTIKGLRVRLPRLRLCQARLTSH